MSPLRILVVGAGVGGIAIARGLLRDGHDVTVFEKRPDATAGGGAVTIWSNGSAVLTQLGVDMTDAGQLISAVRVVTSAGRRLAKFDVTAVVDRLGAPVRMVPRRVLLERLLAGSCRSHPMQLSRSRSRQFTRRSAGRIRRRQLRRRGSSGRRRWPAPAGFAMSSARKLLRRPAGAAGGIGGPSRHSGEAHRTNRRRRAWKRSAFGPLGDRTCSGGSTCRGRPTSNGQGGRSR